MGIVCVASRAPQMFPCPLPVCDLWALKSDLDFKQVSAISVVYDPEPVVASPSLSFLL